MSVTGILASILGYQRDNSDPHNVSNFIVCL